MKLEHVFNKFDITIEKHTRFSFTCQHYNTFDLGEENVHNKIGVCLEMFDLGLEHVAIRQMSSIRAKLMHVCRNILE